MESLNLNALAGSLPNSNLASAEKELLNNFRAAALSITNLYRSSRSTSKRAYNSGYAAACADLMQMIQQSVSDSDSSPETETQPSIGRVLDWVEARLEAVRAREEEEEEEDEEGAASRREKEGQTGRLKASAALPRANSAPAVPQQAPREQAPLAPSKLSQAITTGPTLPSPSTPPSPPAPTLLRPLPTPTTATPASRTLKPRAFASAIQAKENPHLTPTTTTTVMPPILHHPFPMSPGSPSPSPFTFTAFPPLPSSAAPTDALAIPLPLPLTVSAGAKRRHAMMVLADDNAHAHGPATVGAGAMGMAPSGAAGSSRRRTRSTRGAHQNQHAQDAMEIEEDGRERKRVARR